MILALKTLSWVVNLFPQRFLLLVGDTIGWLWYSCLRFRRDVVRENLETAFGNTLSPKEKDRLALRNFQHYGRVLLEILQSINWSQEDYRKRIAVEGIENIEIYTKNCQPGFILSGHLGNWELTIGASVANGVPLDIVVKKARSERAEKVLQWYRQKAGAGVFLESGTAKDILRSFSQGRWVGFILDQFMGPPIGLPVFFFGKQAGTAAAVALLTEKRDVPIVPLYSYRDGQGRVHLVFEPALKLPPLSEDRNERLFQKTQIYNDVLESLIRKHPEQWLWLHRRWKEYRGVPRWQPKGAMALALLLLGLFGTGCTTTGPAPTGIALPPDPKIESPQFQAEGPAQNPGSGTLPPAMAAAADEKSRDENAEPAKVPAEEAKSQPRKKKNRRKNVTANGKPEPSTPVRQPVSHSTPANSLEVFSPDRIPWEIGEKIEMDLTWTAIPAGRAVMEVGEGPTFNNRPTYQITGNVLSSRLVDAFYHVDNSVESFIDKSGLVPYKFLVHMVESYQKKETRVAFDHAHHKAFYWAKRISEKWGNQDIDRSDDVSPEAKDMFSALYYVRVLNYRLGQKQTFPVYENGQNLDVELTPVANEVITSKAGVFQCWKIAVKVALNNVLKPMGDTFLWLSDDSKKYLVRFEAKLKYGALLGTLSSIQERK